MKKSNPALKKAARLTVGLFLIFFIFFGMCPQIPILSINEDGKLAVELVENPLLSSLVQAVKAASGSLTVSVTNLGASYADGTVQSDHGGSAGWTASGDSVTGTVKGQDSGSSGSGCGSTSWDAGASDSTLILTNNYTTAATLSFSYSVTVNGGTIKIDGSSKTSNGTFSKELPAGGSVQVYIQSATGNKETRIVLSSIVLEQKIVNATTTFIPSMNGTYTVDGTAVTSDISRTQASTQAYSLSAAPATGYVFGGWLDVTNNAMISSDNPASICVDENKTITAVFNPDDVAVFQVGNKTFTDLNAADAYASSQSNKKIILISNGKTQNTLYGGNYTISNGNTLLIPFDSSNTMYTTSPSVVYNTYETPTAYRILTMLDGASITVKSGGAISVSGKLSSKGQMGGYNGTPTGPDGRIDMRSGSSITLENNAKLYCWGYIYGGGMVEAKSGSTVYEAFQVKDWRGGTATSNCYSYVFPFNQYYVQNIEVPLKFDAGAAEKLYGAVNASSSAYTLQADFIGSGNSSAMFRISSGYVIKDYLENTDQLSVQVYGNVTLSTLTVSGLPMIGSVDTSDYDLPITNNIKIDIQSGTVTTGQDVKFQPGSEVYIARDAKFQVSSGKKIKVYDLSDWGNFSGSAKMYAIGYSVANGTTAVRTTSNMSDVTIDVNGVLEVAGALYTSAGGANITSTLGTSGNNGRIVFTTAPTSSNVTVYEMEGNSTKTGVTFSAPQLHNGNDTYNQTAGTGTSTWYYDKDGEHWYRFMVDFNYNGARVGRDYFCENGDTINYDASYLVNLGASVTSGSATAAISGTNVVVTNVTADSVVTLTGQAAQFIPTFVLNEHQAENYKTFKGTELTETRTINDSTYYVVKIADAAMDLGASFAAPTDAEMGVSAANYNAITWNLTGVSATSGNNYAGTVPVGPTPEGEVYIYGFYTGYVAYNSATDTYYPTLAEAMAEIPQDGDCTILMVNDCGSFEEENGAWAFPNPAHTNLTFNLNGHHALGRIINNGAMTLELNGGTLDYHTGATAAAAAYAGTATIINSGTMTIQDSVGGGKITSDAISNAAGASGSAVIRNNAGATLTVTGKDAEHLLPLEHTQNVNGNNYGIFNLGTITALTNVDISTKNSGTCGLNVYNYNTGVITLISGGHMFCNANCSIFNYGGTITTIDGLTIDGKNGIVNRNIVSGAIASGYSVTDANKGIIGTITNCHIEVGQYAINNHAVINTLSNSTFIAAPDSAQVDTRGNGLSTASEGNVQCYTIVNNNDWWYNTNVWKQVDSSKSPWTRVNYYKEEEQYRPTIGTITNCNIYAELTSTSSAHGYALTNYGVIGKISGTTNIKAYKHPDNAKSIVGYYAMHNLSGGIIKSIEGTVNISATGIGTVYNDGQFTLQNNYTYANKVAGNITYQKNTYGEPSTINSITCSGTWSCGGSSSYYYALMNSGYIGTINSTGLTLEGGYNVLYNTTGGANKTYEITKSYTDGATASTEYERVQHYVKNLTKGSTIGTINGITVTGKGSKSYYPFNNQGHIGTLSNVTVNFAEGATANTSYYVAFLNGDSRYQELNYTIRTNRTSATDPLLTVSAGVVTRYDRDYTYSTPTIDVIDNLTVNSITLYAFRNAGHIGELKNSTITGTQYALHNYAIGPFTERQTLQYYSGTGIFATTKSTSEYNKHYKRDPATIDLIDNCTITTPANTYAVFNSGHVGTIKNSTIQAGTTTAKAYALWNGGASTIVGTEREYTCNLEDYFYVTANTTTACTAYWGSGGESKVQTYDYDVPTIDLIGEGNTFKATSTVIANTGVITAIDSGEGELTTITGTAAKGSSIYNYSACLNARTTTTPYTAAASAGASGTAGTAVNDDTLLSGAQIGTIRNVYINANGYGILNGDAAAGKTPTISEIGEGTEIYAHCTTAGYHAIYNQANAKITGITGGIYTTTKATTNAYKNNNTAEGYATVISGGDFKGMAVGRNNAIFEPDNTSRQTYAEGKTLSTGTESVTLHDGSAGTGYCYLTENYTVTFNVQDHGAAPADQTVESGQKIVEPDAPSAEGYRFDGWYREAGCITRWNFDTDTVTANTTLFAKWTAAYTVTFNVNGHGEAPASQAVESGQKIAEPDVPSAEGYRFDGWYREAGCITPWDFDTDTVSANTTLFAKWTALYTVTWKNGSETLEIDTDIPEGASPSYNGTTPVKEETDQYSYTFSGWATSDGQESGTDDSNLPAVAANVTYYAAFSKTQKGFTVTWMTQNGGTAYEMDEHVTGRPSYDSAEPEKPATDQYTYTFAGWSTSVNAVSGTAVSDLPVPTADIIYYAAFSAKKLISYSGITVSIPEQTYTGAVLTPVISVKNGSAVLAADADYTVSISGDCKDAGSYTVTINGIGDYAGSRTAPFTIVPKTVNDPTIILSQDTYTYDGTAKTPSVTVKDGEMTIPAGEYSVTYGNNTAAGQAVINISDKDGGNYIVNGSRYFAIDPAVLEVTASGCDVVYDGSAHSITVSAPDGAEVSFCAEENGTYSSINPSYTDAGSYTVYYRAEKANYTTVTGSAMVEIAKKDIGGADVTLGETLTYTGSLQAQTVTAVTVDGLTVTGYEVTNNTGTDAGSYTLTVTAPAAGNFTGSAEKTFTIAKAGTNEVTVSMIGWTYGDEANMPVVSSDFGTAACTYSRTENDGYTPAVPTDAGIWFVKAAVAETDDYAGGSAVASFTIENRPLIITADSGSKTYDGAALKKDTFTSSGLADGDSIISVTITGEQTDAGSSENVPSAAVILRDGADAADNYTITYKNGTLTVTPLTGVTVTIVGANDTAVYDGQEHSVSGYTAEISSAVYSEADFTFNGTASAACTDAGTAYMGLTADRFTNNNLNFAEVVFRVTDGSMTVVPKPVTITARDQTVELDGSIDTSVSQTVTSGLVPGHTLTAVTLTADSTANATNEGTITPRDAAIRSGSTDVTANYDITYMPGILTVNKAVPTVTVEAVPGLRYNGDAQALVTGSASGGTLQYSLDGTAWSADIPTGTNAGEYTVYYRVAGNDNYSGVDADSVTAAIANAAQTAPSVGHTDETRDGRNDGTITGMTEAMEYSTDGVSYVRITVDMLTDGVLNGLADGIYHVRFAAKPNYDASPAVTVVIGAGAKYTVIWKNGDTTLETDEGVAYGTIPTYDGDEPAKTADDQYSYTFSGWTPSIAGVTDDVTYTAVYTWNENTYTVVWKNEDGSVLETDEDAIYGTIPTYDGEVPSKAATGDFGYTFSGWTPEVTAVTGTVTYTAVFAEKARTYGAPVWSWNGVVSAEAAFTTTDEFAVFTQTVTATGKNITCVTVVEDCETDGLDTYTATISFRGESYTNSKEDIRNALGHDLTAHAAAAATCTEAGNSAYWVCSRCGKYFGDAAGTEQIEEGSWIIAALGHNPGTAGEENRTEATCTAAGSYDEVVRCLVCGEELSRTSKTIPSLGHDYQVTVTASTCTASGYTTHICSRCEDSYTDAQTEPLGHDWGAPVWTWTGNEEDGYTAAAAVITCSRCGESESGMDVALDYEVTIPATETMPGTGVYTAEVIIRDETYTAAKEVSVQYMKLDYPNFTIVGVTAEFNPDRKREIVSITDTIAGTFELTYPMGCLVAVKTINTETGAAEYTRLYGTPVEGKEDTYCYSLEDLDYVFSSDIELVITLKGDVNGDGKINALDAAQVKAASISKLNLGGLSLFSADVNSDERINALDAAQIKAASISKLRITWDIKKAS